MPKPLNRMTKCCTSHHVADSPSSRKYCLGDLLKWSRPSMRFARCICAWDIARHAQVSQNHTGDRS